MLLSSVNCILVIDEVSIRVSVSISNIDTYILLYRIKQQRTQF